MRDLQAHSAPDLGGRVRARLDKWRSELLDLTRSNRLVHYKPSAKALRLQVPDVFTIADRIDADGQGWRFYEPPDLGSATQHPLDAPATTSPASPLASNEPEDGVVYAHEPNPKKLRSALKALKQRAHEALEERGVHVLYLAAGMLHWTEAESLDVACSPLILFPVTIEQESRTQPYELVPSDDEEIIVNAGLQEKLRRDLGIELPDLPPADQVDRSDGDELCRRYLEQVDALLTPEQRERGWRVTHDAWLDVFTFHKLVMYVDLEKNAARIVAHPAIAAIACGAAAPDAFGPPPPNDEELDERALVRDACHVMDADSSQLAVLEAVRRGTSLVLVGPPGTGKSQTIANAISQSLAEGKTVLFVSEKMEALKVVYDRLRDVGIDDLCLQLHSHKANKKAVVQELARRLTERLEPRLAVDESALIKLDQRRESLNEYTRELHKIRRPLGKSIRHVLAELVAVADIHVPAVPAAERAVVEQMTGETWQQIQDCAASLASAWYVVEAPERLVWRDARAQVLDGQTNAEIAAEIAALERALHAVRDKGAALAARFAWTPPVSADAAQEQMELAQHLRASPGVPASLFSTPFELLQERMAACRAQVAEIARLRGQVGALVPEQPRLRAGELRAAAQQLADAFRGWLTAEVTVAIAQSLPPLLRELADAADAYAVAAESVQSFLGLAERFTPASLQRLRRLADYCIDSRPLPSTLLVPAQLLEARSQLPKRKQLWSAANEAAGALAEIADDALLELDLEGLLASYRTNYNSFLRVFMPSYWKAERTIKAHLRSGSAKLPRTELLERAREVKGYLSTVEALEGQDAELFGSLAHGRSTDVMTLDAAVARAADVFEIVDARPLPAQLVAMLSSAGLVSAAFRSAVERLNTADTRFKAAVDRLAGLGGGSAIAAKVNLQDAPIVDIAGWARNALAVLDKPALGLGVIPPQAGSYSLNDYASLLDLDDARRRSLAALDSVRDELTALFGDAYRGEATDFAALQKKLDYVELLRSQYFPLLTPAVVALAAKHRPAIAELEDAEQAAAMHRSADAALARRFVATTVTAYGQPLASRTYADASAAVVALRRARHEISDLARVEAVKRRFHELGLGQTLDVLLKSGGSAEEFEKRLRGTLHQCWLDRQIASIPILRDFNGLEHERRVAEFREIDRRMWEHGAHRVIAGFNSHQPEDPIHTQEHALLRRESVKSRRLMPLRRLFTELPTLIPRLKPCLMMSPISVAQYLADSDMNFDLVVFDEASQIAPEDAIGAIMRGRQVIVCGDPKQLPPTAFFERSFLVESDEYDEAEDALNVDSILEELQGAGLPEQCLRWHYRSQHPDLIEFSNQKFYESRLVTFPNRVATSDQLGVKFVHVKDGIYDRGKSRTNRKEAERVAELVIEHWKRFGREQTLAVVTLSTAQRDAVQAALEDKLKSFRDFEGYFHDEERDGFRIKNLETVQGDERDVVIVSIGYGPDGTSKEPALNFGPINKDGGARLNVLVTRAKRKLIVVASFRGQDISPERTANDGVRLLCKYMEYAERGPSVLAAEVEGGGDFESPLEASVAAAVRELGYEVVPQVGCGRYRIDLGVRRPDTPGGYLLGIECDGARYHGSVTARDRDRLRQQTLEQKFGWIIHRIWGADWLRSRSRELERLRSALDRAVACDSAVTLAVPTAARLPITKKTVPPPEDLKSSDARPAWAHTFVPADAARLGLESNRPVPDDPVPVLAQQIARIAEAENGVHFDRAVDIILVARGIKRKGSVIRQHFQRARRALPTEFTLEAEFVYPPGYEARVLVWDGVSERRELEAIPWRELELAAQKLLAGAGALPWDELIDKLARLYGVQRVTQQGRAALDPAMKAACKAGRFVHENGRVRNA